MEVCVGKEIIVSLGRGEVRRGRWHDAREGILWHLPCRTCACVGKRTQRTGRERVTHPASRSPPCAAKRRHRPPTSSTQIPAPTWNRGCRYHDFLLRGRACAAMSGACAASSMSSLCFKLFGIFCSTVPAVKTAISRHLLVHGAPQNDCHRSQLH